VVRNSALRSARVVRSAVRGPLGLPIVVTVVGVVRAERVVWSGLDGAVGVCADRDQSGGLVRAGLGVLGGPGWVVAGDQDVEVDGASQGEGGDGGQHRDDVVAQAQSAVVGLLVEADGVQGVGPDAGGGGGGEQGPGVEAGAQGCGGHHQQGADAVGDESVDDQREEVAELGADVDGNGHLLQGVVGQGAPGAAKGDDRGTVPPSNRRWIRCESG